MRTWWRYFATVIGLVGLGGCSTLHSVSLTPIPAERQRVVKASVEKTTFLLFSANNNFVEELPRKLRAQCEGGVVSGILTKHYNIHYFILTKMVVEAQGFCVKKG